MGCFYRHPLTSEFHRRLGVEEKGGKGGLGGQGQLALPGCRAVPSRPGGRDSVVCCQMKGFGLWVQEKGASVQQGSGQSW